MISAGIAFFLGVLTVSQLQELPSVLWLWLAVPLCAVWFITPRLRFIYAFVLGFLWALGFAQYRLGQELPQPLIGQDVLVAGYIASIPVVDEQKRRFEFEIHEQLDKSSNARLRLPLKVRLSWYGRDHQSLPVLQAGDYWQLKLRLKRPHGLMNPGGFDYEGWLFGRGIRATGYVRPGTQNMVLDAGRYRHGVQRLRQSLLMHLETVLPSGRNNGIITALALGHRASIQAEDWELLLSTGTNHLMAISGLHIGLIAALSYWLVLRIGGWLLAFHAVRYPCWPLQRIAALAAFVSAFMYALLAGFALPTQRALIMLAVGLLSLLSYRPLRPGRSLLLALLAVLLFDPFAVSQPGFWLSFGAVAILTYIVVGRLKPDMRKGLRLLRWGRLQWALILALAPITLYWFGRAAISAGFANFIAIPLVAFLVVPAVLAAVLCSLIWPAAAVLIFRFADILLNGLWWVLEYARDWPFAQWLGPSPPLWAVLLAIVGMIWLLAPRGLPGRWIGVFWLFPLLMNKPVPPEHGVLRLTFLDVGQGTAVVAQTRRHLLIYDTGPRYSERFDMGQVVLLPYLRSLGADKVDTLIVSHGDNDHIGGASAIQAALPVNQVLSSVPERLQHASACRAGQSWEWDGVHFDMLYPVKPEPYLGNNSSCVLRITVGDQAVLLAGDIERTAEIGLLVSGKLEPLAILLVPHHGSRTSSMPRFVETVRPEYAIISAGYRNRYGFPKADVLARYRDQGASLAVTGIEGALHFVIKQQNVSQPSAFRREQARFWHNRPWREE